MKTTYVTVRVKVQHADHLRASKIGDELKQFLGSVQDYLEGETGYSLIAGITLLGARRAGASRRADKRARAG